MLQSSTMVNTAPHAHRVPLQQLTPMHGHDPVTESVTESTFRPAPKPANEPHRLAALQALQILDTAPDESFDRITLLAQQTFKVATALVSLVDDKRQWFKSKQGLSACETQRDISFCGHAILEDDPLIVEDALLDERFCGNPLVIGAPFVRSYVGYPLHDPTGYRVGTLCLIDPAPRHYTADELTLLKGFAGMTEHALSNLVQSRAQVVALNQFDVIFDATPVGFVLVDAQGQIAMLNQRICRLLDYSAQELVGQSLDMLLPQRFREGHMQKLRAYCSSPIARPMGAGRDLFATRRDGSEFPVEIGLTPLETVNGRQVLATIVDITERKTNESRLLSANARLEEFAYIASHDLRSPLRGISDLLEWIQEDIGEITNPKVLNNFQRASSRVLRLETIIDRLLIYARAGAEDCEQTAFDPREMVTNIVELQPRPPGIEVQIGFSPMQIVTAKTPLATVLRNLISNAIKHHDRDHGLIRVDARARHGLIEFAVSDDGPGIAMQAQSRIFKIFQIASTVSQGSGLGLAICKRLVEAHGGAIVVESVDKQRGTTFRFTWPGI